jgi:hypothetical protein
MHQTTGMHREKRESEKMGVLICLYFVPHHIPKMEGTATSILQTRVLRQ